MVRAAHRGPVAVLPIDMRVYTGMNWPRGPGRIPTAYFLGGA